jgi:hypothetical protein
LLYLTIPFLKCEGRDTKQGNRGASLPIPNLSTRWQWVINFMPLLLYPWEVTPVSTENIRKTHTTVRLERALPAVWMFWKREKSLAPGRFQALGCPDHGSVTIPIMLSHLPLTYQENMHCPEEDLVIRTKFMHQHPHFRHLSLSWWCLSYQTSFHP